MTSSTRRIKIEHPRKANFLYYMCLLDWGGAILDEAMHKVIAQSIMPDSEETKGWHVMWKEDAQLGTHGVNPKFLAGFYHSRIILRFELAASPETISQVREIRQAMEDFTERYLKENVFPQARRVSSIYPKAFIYPVFELNAHCRLWEFATTSPYTLPTACFYTDLRDPEQPRWRFLRCLLCIPWLGSLVKAVLPATVKMRMSGAKLITSPMSDWFFWNLTNVVYHEGLYRQSRERQIISGEVYRGLELRLEDFADELMASFSQSIANIVQRTLSWWLLLVTILLVVVTIASVALLVISLVQD